jgi:hypothetical protein
MPVNDYEVDYELIRETLVQFGERMEALGFPKILEDIEGTGKVGKCARDPRDTERIATLIKYLKGLGADLVQEERALLARGQMDPAIMQAKQALEECYQTMKLCVVDTQGPEEAAAMRRRQAEAARRVQPTMRVPAPQVRRALPAAQLTPAQIAQVRAMQAAQAQGRVLVPQVLPPAQKRR